MSSGSADETGAQADGHAADDNVVGAEESEPESRGPARAGVIEVFSDQTFEMFPTTLTSDAEFVSRFGQALRSWATVPVVTPSREELLDPRGVAGRPLTDAELQLLLS